MRRSDVDLVSEVATLGDLSRDDLTERWRLAYGHPPPKGIRHELLVRSASWHLQERRLGGLSSATRRVLKAAMTDVELAFAARRGGKTLRPGNTSAGPAAVEENDVSVDTSIEDGMNTRGPKVRARRAAAPSVAGTRRRQTLAPGARLVRDWNGKTHVVDVIEEGFVFQAKIHRSLTAIARQITGAHWSGPRFFGL